MKPRKPNLLVIGNLHSSISAQAFLTGFARIAKALGDEVYILSADPPELGPGIHWTQIRLEQSNSEIQRPFLFAMAQARVALLLMEMRDKFDVAIVLATPFLLPMACLKAMRKKIVLHVDGKGDSIVANALSRLSFALADQLATEAWSLLDFWGIRSRAKAKLCTQSVDLSLFKVVTPLTDRDTVVCFVGGLDRNKGIREMLEAIRLLNRAGHGFKYVIGGGGEMRDLVRRFASENPNVKYEGQIPWNRVCDTLNQCRLLVVPSFSEGLPNIMLEAMACGTPVLASAVGGIPDVITDGVTGFIMPSNSPESIVANIVRAINDPRLSEVAENALEMTRSEFSYGTAVKRYAQVISVLEEERL